MNKPIAWMFEKDGAYMCFKNIDGVNFENGIPLYTHPVELTDEEINDIAQQCWVYPQSEQAIFNQHKFARAILRKAQE